MKILFATDGSAHALAALIGHLDWFRDHTAAKRVGEPAPVIVKAAHEGAFDLIAMGTQGHTALATLMLGSVSAKVLAESAVPVLLLR